MYKKVSSKIILQHPRLTVTEDIIQLPNGKETDYVHFGERADAASILAINSEGKILLTHEYAYPPNMILIQIPGGAVPKGEDPAAGAMRELQEETGFSANTFIPLGSYLIQERRSSNKMYVYLAKDLEENPLPQDEEENITVHWYTEQEVEDMIKNGEIINVHTLAAWALYQIHHK